MKLPPHRFRLAAAVRRAVSDLPAGAPVVVACSGGPDSLALAAAAADAGVAATAAVVDHGLQPDSAVVAAGAAAQCERLGLAAQVLRVVVRPDGSGPEAAARARRYEALDEAAAQLGAAAVLLGHTRDDQAETVLLGLVRGSGTRSLAGMPPRRGRYRRPFLDLPRPEVLAALREHDLQPWQDPHNTDRRYLRSRVRQVVMPMLAEQLGPAVIGGLARTARLARADADALDAIARERGRVCAEAGWRAADLAALPDALRWRVLRAMLLAAGCPPTDLTLEHVLAVDGLVTRWRGQGPLHLPGGVTVVRDCGSLTTQSRRGGTHDGYQQPR